MLPQSEPFVARRPGAHVGASARAPHAPSRPTADFGPLAPLVADPRVTDIFVNGAHDLWVDRGAGLERQVHERFDESELRELAVRLMALGGRHIDEATPVVDTRLGDGIRVHAVLPPLSPRGTLLSIRVPHPSTLSLADLDTAGDGGPALTMTVPGA